MKTKDEQNKIEDHIVSLETAKKLKEAGFGQGNTLYLWYENGGTAQIIDQMHKLRPFEYKSFDCPLATEIELPSHLDIKKNQLENMAGRYILHIINTESLNEVVYVKIGGRFSQFFVGGVNEADARGRMKLYLKDKGLI
jgi:hypothetical protein